jgi:hypothetical protein
MSRLSARAADGSLVVFGLDRNLGGYFLTRFSPTDDSSATFGEMSLSKDGLLALLKESLPLEERLRLHTELALVALDLDPGDAADAGESDAGFASEVNGRASDGARVSFGRLQLSADAEADLWAGGSYYACKYDPFNTKRVVERAYNVPGFSVVEALNRWLPDPERARLSAAIVAVSQGRDPAEVTGS